MSYPFTRPQRHHAPISSWQRIPSMEASMAASDTSIAQRTKMKFFLFYQRLVWVLKHQLTFLQKKARIQSGMNCTTSVHENLQHKSFLCSFSVVRRKTDDHEEHTNRNSNNVTNVHRTINLPVINGKDIRPNFAWTKVSTAAYPVASFYLANH